MKALIFTLVIMISPSSPASEKLNFAEPVTLKKTEFNIKKIYVNFLQIYQAMTTKRSKATPVKEN